MHVNRAATTPVALKREKGGSPAPTPVGGEIKSVLKGVSDGKKPSPSSGPFAAPLGKP